MVARVRSASLAFSRSGRHNRQVLYKAVGRLTCRGGGPVVRVLPVWLGPGRLRLALPLGLALGATVHRGDDRRALQGTGVARPLALLLSDPYPRRVWILSEQR